jgi:hypothetical protein
MERGGDCNYCFCLSHGERMRHLIAHFDAGQKSAWGRCSGGECQPSREFREARFWIASGLPTIRE